jgi:hypothetical protein
MSKEKKLIFVLGMHRSGTSVLARMLNLLGVDLGVNLIEAQAGVNEKGFWEHTEVVEINEALLSRLDSCWYDIRPLPASWWQDPQLDDLKDRAGTFLETAFSSELSVIKDPRLCLLLPFWQQVAEAAGWAPVVVLANRHPHEVAASLCKRDPLDDSTARLLWLRYFHEAETHSRQLPRCLVDYQRLLNDWRTVAQTISDELGIQWPMRIQQMESVIDKEVDPGLRHQKASEQGKADTLDLLIAKVYKALPDMTNSAQLDGLWREFDHLSRSSELLAKTLLASNRQLMEVSNELLFRQALEMVSKRDGQLEIANHKLEMIGLEHEEALNQLAKYERFSQFPPIRLVVNGVRKGARMLSGRSHEH